MRFPYLVLVFSWMIIICACNVQDRIDQDHINPDDEIMILKEARAQGNEQSLWYFCEKRDLKPLLPNTKVTIAEIAGPAVIRLIRLSRLTMLTQPDFPRGIILEIYWDGNIKPAVQVPVADFFLDGCNAKVEKYFASTYFEIVPGAYNCYMPMAFKKGAKVVLRNETAHTYLGYANVEWEQLPEWSPELAYFHATYNRRIFRLTPESKVTFFKAEGKGHIVGRQVSVSTDEPLYSDHFGWVMEGNVNFYTDGAVEAPYSYLGSEDSYTFSHGFSDVWTGLHAGITYFRNTNGDEPAELSVFRFHDKMPIRFNTSLTWEINWQYETMFGQPPTWRKAIGENGGWVDYACVTYFYLDSPGGYDHKPLRQVAQRTLDILGKPANPVVGEHLFEFGEQIVEQAIEKAYNEMDVDPVLINRISTLEDMERFCITGAYPGTHPFFIDTPKSPEEARKRNVWGHPGDPSPGRNGIVAVHPQNLETPCLLIRKVKLPESSSYLHIVMSGDPYEVEMPGQRDVVLRIGVYDGSSTKWLDEKLIIPGPATKEGWYTFGYDLSGFAGKKVALVVETAAGGVNHWFNEEAFYDEISVIEGRLPESERTVLTPPGKKHSAAPPALSEP